MEERRERVEFLWRASHHYSTRCPQLAAYLRRVCDCEVFGARAYVAPCSKRMTSIAGPVLPTPVLERLCPVCGHILLPPPPSPHPPSSHPPKVKTVSKKRLKAVRRRSRGRKGAWLTTPLGSARSYMVSGCHGAHPLSRLSAGRELCLWRLFCSSCSQEKATPTKQ